MGDMDAYLPSRRQALVGAVLLLAALLLAGKLLGRAGQAAPPTAEPQRAVLAPSQPRRLVVHVVGAVRRPGLYRLRDGSRVADALSRAGGASRRADLALVNLAAPVGDGSQIVVPRRAEPGVAARAPAAEPSAPLLSVSLNSATLEALDALPGVGPVTAQRILDYRSEHGAFASVDELDAVPGIGPARLEQLRALVTL